MTTEERRRYSRITFDALANLTSDSVNLTATVLDLSLKGVLLEFESPQDLENTAYMLGIALTPEMNIEMELEPTHTEGNHIGFVCKHIDIESLGHLRRIVELNTGDSSLLDRELAQLFEGK